MRKTERYMAEWYTEDGRLYHKTPDGEDLVMPWPPYFFGHAIDRETGTCYTTVTFRNIDGGLDEHTFDRRDLFDESRIVAALAPLGFMVTSANAPLVVKWLTDVCNSEEGEPLALASTHLGWVEGSKCSFLPGGDEGIRLVVPNGMERINRAFETSGTVIEWAKALGEVRQRSMACRAMLAASAAAPLVRMLGLRPFVFYLWHHDGLSSAAALQAAGSVWGDSSIGAGYLPSHVPPLPDSMSVASFLRDIPYLQGNLLMSYDKGDHEAMRRATEWTLALMGGDAHSPAPALALATGEVPLVVDSNRKLLRNRVLNIDPVHIMDPELALPMDDAVRRLHGTAGHRIAHILSECGRDATRRMWDKALGRLGWLVHDKWIREMIVLVCLGDALLRRAAFFQRDSLSWDKALDEAEGLCRWLRIAAIPGGNRLTYGRDVCEAKRFLRMWVEHNQDRFAPFGDEDDLAMSCSTMGYYADEANTELVVDRDTVEDLLSREGHDRDWTLFRLSDRGVVVECPIPRCLEQFSDEYDCEWVLIDTSALREDA